VIISHELEFVFLGIPRTANRSTHVALLELPGAHRHGLLHEMTIPQRCRDYFTFCAVRNPYRRFVSWYRWRSLPHPWGGEAENMTFESYIVAVENGQLGPMTVHEHTGGNRLDHVFRFEELPHSLHAIEQIPGIETTCLEKCGEKLSRHWHKYYDQRTADRVFEICRSDFDDFGYQRKSWQG